MEPRPYQAEAFDAARKGNIVMVGATGVGKVTDPSMLPETEKSDISYVQHGVSSPALVYYTPLRWTILKSLRLGLSFRLETCVMESIATNSAIPPRYLA